jgi:hypothetical protein
MTQTACKAQMGRAVLSPCRWAVRPRVHRPSQFSGPAGVVFTRLSNCISNPPPDRCTGTVAYLSKLRRPYRALRLSLVATAFQHQGGDAPDGNLWGHSPECYPARVYLRLILRREPVDTVRES